MKLILLLFQMNIKVTSASVQYTKMKPIKYLADPLKVRGKSKLITQWQ